MLRTDEVRKMLKNSNEPIAFNDIWEKIKDVIIPTISVEYTEDRIKSDLYFSLMEDSSLIMLGKGLWDLKERYSLHNQEIVAKSRVVEESELVWEESEETKELNLKIISTNDNN